MHGRVKVRTTAEQEELKKIERAKKLTAYKKGISLIFQKRKDGIWDDELLSITERMLLQNPDIYTLWNIRREAFLNNTWNEETHKAILERELTLTENCLRENPKSYSSWFQRCWVMDHLREPDWLKELSLCTKYLNIDERNFHCWDYRQYVVEKSGVSDQEEFDFSTSKILTNFSNYSSWHYRSKILSKLFPDETEKLPIDRTKHKDELDLVMDATFTDPNDSSAWFYQRWLLEDVRSTSPTLWGACINKDLIVVAFDDDVSVKTMNLFVLQGDENINGEWVSHDGNDHAKVWLTKVSKSLDNDAKNRRVILGTNEYPLHRLDTNELWLYKRNTNLINKSHNEEQLKGQLKNYEQLSTMEPNNKWTLLTKIFLMKKIDFIEYKDQILYNLDVICKVDPLRSNYYKDLRSKYIFDYTLYMVWKDDNDSKVESKIDLSGLGLSKLYNNQYLSLFQEINLGANNLGNCLRLFSTLQNVAKLSLSSNQISSVKLFPTLPNLEVLSLRNNNLNDVEEILNLLSRHKLIALDLRDNPMFDIDNTKKIKDNYSYLELY